VARVLLAAVAPPRRAPCPSRAARLGADLTVGAERGANADGTLPAWTGGITVPPPGSQPAARPVDPYAGEPSSTR
jgi:hypothetical protein